MTDLLIPHAPLDVPVKGLLIGDAAAVSRISADTLRYYEKQNLLLTPTRRNTAGRRLYSSRDLGWIAGLIMLRETGMSIAQMREMAVLYRTPGAEVERLALLERHRAVVVFEQQRVAAHLAAIDHKIASYRSALVL